MSSWRNIVGYFSKYKAIAIFSIAASSLFEIIDLIVPYCIGQILNVLSLQPLDKPLVKLITVVQKLGHFPTDQWLSLGVLLGIIFLVTVVRSPIQPWIGVWHHWAIALNARRDNFMRGSVNFSLKDLRVLISKEELLEKHQENTESRTSEIITNIKTVKSFATEAQEYQRQLKRFEREFKYVTYRIHRGYVDLITWSRTVIQKRFCRYYNDSLYFWH